MKTAERFLEYAFALDMLSGGVSRDVVLSEIRAIQADAIEAAAREVIEWYGKHEELAGELLDRVRALKPAAPASPEAAPQK